MRAVISIIGGMLGLLAVGEACGSEDSTPSAIDGGADARTSPDADATSSGESSCVAAGGSCVCFSPCGGEQHNEPSLVASCAGPPGAPGCAEMYCCLPGAPDAGDPDAGAHCDAAGDTCCDPYPGDGPNYCTGGLMCCSDNTCAATCS